CALPIFAGVELALARPLADVLIGGPALGAGVDRGPGRVVAVVGDVVAVLVGDRVIARHPVGGAVDAGDHHLADARRVAGKRTGAADAGDLVGAGDVDRERIHLLPVHEAAEHVG